MEALKWIYEFKFKTNLPSILQHLYTFWIYHKVTRSCNEEQIAMIMNEISQAKTFTSGLWFAINRLQCDYIRAKRDKEEYIENAGKNESYTVKDFMGDEAVEESFRWKGLSEDELRKKYERLPVGKEITLELILQQQVIGQGDEGNVHWEIHDRIHGYYSALIWSPHRIRPNGKQGVLILYDDRWKGITSLETQVKTEIIFEAKRQSDWELRKNQK